MQPYESLYGSVLLDDIHNYFPALLYEPARFSTVAEILSYVQLQTRNRFDLFARGREAYLRTVNRPVVTPYAVRQNIRSVTPARAPRIPRVEVAVDVDDQVSAVLAGGSYSPGDLVSAATLLGLMTNLRVPMTPVIVRPTVEQIEAATTVDIVSNDAAEQCSICQQQILRGTERRTIDVCHHEFHSSCVDVWFQQNVRCPNCRHDIRETE